jgi:ribonuclease-3
MPTIDQKIFRAERILNYTFLNKALCAEALQMAAPLALLNFDGNLQRVYRNNRLAILGDATLAQTMCKMWYSATTVEGNCSILSSYASC